MSMYTRRLIATLLRHASEYSRWGLAEPVRQSVRGLREGVVDKGGRCQLFGAETGLSAYCAPSTRINGSHRTTVCES